ncbi:MAG: dicarboxylate/amino acid:cation symporter, partial [Planctomycetota bacterium]
ILFSICALSVGGATLRRFDQLANDGFGVMMRLTMAIIQLAPYGVALLMFYVTATQGFAVFRALGWYLITVSSGLLFHAVITLPLLLLLFARRNPLHFFQAMAPALLTAFSSASSNATLPLTLTCVEKRAGVRNSTSGFVLPLGATINMDGTALYEAVAVLFIGQLYYGASFGLGQQIAVAITALLASVGAAGIPHAGLVMMAIVLQAVDLPIEFQGIILAVDRVLDMMRTAVNVWSDSCGAAVIDRWIGDLPTELESTPAESTG